MSRVDGLSFIFLYIFDIKDVKFASGITNIHPGFTKIHRCELALFIIGTFRC